MSFDVKNIEYHYIPMLNELDQDEIDETWYTKVQYMMIKKQVRVLT